MGKWLVAAAVLLLVAVLGWQLWGPSQAPSGQPPMLELNTENVASLKRGFNEASDRVRIIALLSPT
ncbi:MAG TPA: hypothetical protein VLE48_14570 [Terriglobales bacterium]|nr:hypothetical protein [Terriglobales bacterium]